MKILVINSGSSSIKYQLFEMPDSEVLVKGIVDKIGLPDSVIRIQKKNKPLVTFEKKIANHKSAIDAIIHLLIDSTYGCLQSLSYIDAVGHRIGHGGSKFQSGILLNQTIIEELQNYNELAPLHNPPNLEGITALRKLVPEIKQVAVFDTAFHRTIPEHAYMYALPYSWYRKYHIRRYGFHGTSHYYVSRRACELLNLELTKQKIISCHLGNGSSIAAIDNGKSVDTSMGFTPLEGLIMGTRPGDVDVGILPYIMNKENLDYNTLINLLNKESGLLGITGISSDLREIEVMAETNPIAQLALEMYWYRIKKYIGAYSAVLNGCDLLIFTGGIGENSAITRHEVCNTLNYLGVKINSQINNTTKNEEKVISSENSKVTAMVIPTNEELVIAKETMDVISEKQ